MGFAIWLGCTVLAAALGGWLLAWFEGRWRMSERRAEAMGRFWGWAIFAAGIYAGVALTTFGFQSYIRSHQCSGYRACAVSLTKGAVWSAIWPVLWPVYLAGA